MHKRSLTIFFTVEGTACTVYTTGLKKMETEWQTSGYKNAKSNEYELWNPKLITISPWNLNSSKSDPKNDCFSMVYSPCSLQSPKLPFSGWCDLGPHLPFFFLRHSLSMLPWLVWTHYVDQVSLELINILLPLPRVLGLKVCTTSPSSSPPYSSQRIPCTLE